MVGGVAAQPPARRPHSRLRPGRARASADLRSSSPATTSARPTRPARRSSSCRCDLFVTEATFGLPVFRHEPRRAARSAGCSPRSPPIPSARIFVGVYGLGKCQRMIVAPARRPATTPRSISTARSSQLCDFYQRQGIALGDSLAVDRRHAQASDSPAPLVIVPALRPSPTAGRAACADPLTAFASGWMRVRARARQRGVELPLVISDHADWPELIDTIAETGAAGGLGHPRPRGGAGARSCEPQG